MSKYYPYRFKTREEFEKEFGEHWMNVGRDIYNVSYWIPKMNYLFGKPYEHILGDYVKGGLRPTKRLINLHTNNHNFGICGYMLTENIRIPNYKPRKIIRE